MQRNEQEQQREVEGGSSPMDIHSAVYTFSCFAEGHVGMEVVSNKAALRGENKALSQDELMRVKEHFEARGAEPVLYQLKKHEDEPNATVLFIPNGISFIGANPDGALEEMKRLGRGGMDTTFLHRSGRVLKKHARYNFNVGDLHQEPDIENGKNTLYAFQGMTEANKIRTGISALGTTLGYPHLLDLLAEANIYYDDTCGIRYHGDEERKQSPVIAVNFGEKRFLCKG